jgi:hypothetical protein
LEGRLKVEAIGQNLLDARVQQHVFGDILSRRLEARLTWTL